VPKRIRGYFRYNRKLLGYLFDAVWASIKTELVPVVSQVEGAVAGLVATVQTSGEALNWQPHLHGMLSDGVWLPDGSFKPLEALRDEASRDTLLKKLTEAFAKHVLEALREQGLLDAADVTQILSQEHSGFSVWLGEPFEEQGRELFVARYIERGPISLEKLSLNHDIVTYTTKDGTAHEFDALGFLALLTSHLPNKGESITRYFGKHSCRTRGEERKQKEKATPVSAIVELPEPKNAPSYTWAACMKRLYELDPLKCPKCSSTMRIIAFITDQHEIEKIMESQGIPKSQAPPPIPKALLKDELCQDLFPSDSEIN
jgi:hypothetical protein